MEIAVSIGKRDPIFSIIPSQLLRKLEFSFEVSNHRFQQMFFSYWFPEVAPTNSNVKIHWIQNLNFPPINLITIDVGNVEIQHIENSKFPPIPFSIYIAYDMNNMNIPSLMPFQWSGSLTNGHTLCIVMAWSASEFLTCDRLVLKTNLSSK